MIVFHSHVQDLHCPNTIGSYSCLWCQAKIGQKKVTVSPSPRLTVMSVGHAGTNLSTIWLPHMLLCLGWLCWHWPQSMHGVAMFFMVECCEITSWLAPAVQGGWKGAVTRINHQNKKIRRNQADSGDSLFKNQFCYGIVFSDGRPASTFPWDPLKFGWNFRSPTTQ